MRISARAEQIEPFYVMEVAKAASKLAREVAHTDRPMIFLNIGEPDFTAPPLVQEAAAKAIRDGVTQYTHATGLESLRERISGWYSQRFGVRRAGAAHHRHRRRFRRIAAGLPGADRGRRRNPDAGPELPLQPAFRERCRRPGRAGAHDGGRALPAERRQGASRTGATRRAACCWRRRRIPPARRSTRTNCAASTASSAARAASPCSTRSTWA